MSDNSTSGQWAMYTGSDGTRYLVLATGQDDNSPVHKHWEHGQYSEECFGCWAGYAHTVNYHEERKAKQ